MEHLFLMFLDHTQQRTTVGRTPLDEWSARRRDVYLTTDKYPCPPVGFEPTISAGERPQAAGQGIFRLQAFVLRFDVYRRDGKFLLSHVQSLHAGS